MILTPFPHCITHSQAFHTGAAGPARARIFLLWLDIISTHWMRAKKSASFSSCCSDFLPLDIWPGLRDAPRQYEVRAIPMNVPDSEDEEELADGDLSAVKPGFLEPCKMVCMQLIPT